MFGEMCCLPVFCVQHLSIYFYLSSIPRIFTSEIWFVLVTANCKGITFSEDRHKEVPLDLLWMLQKCCSY